MIFNEHSKVKIPAILHLCRSGYEYLPLANARRDTSANIFTDNQAIIFPRTVVERALYHHSVGVIVAHNHPSGFNEPSEEDRTLTTALETVNIKLLDHIIIGGTSYFSFNETLSL